MTDVVPRWLLLSRRILVALALVFLLVEVVLLVTGQTAAAQALSIVIPVLIVLGAACELSIRRRSPADAWGRSRRR